MHSVITGYTKILISDTEKVMCGIKKTLSVIPIVENKVKTKLCLSLGLGELVYMHFGIIWEKTARCDCDDYHHDSY